VLRVRGLLTVGPAEDLVAGSGPRDGVRSNSCQLPISKRMTAKRPSRIVIRSSGAIATTADVVVCSSGTMQVSLGVSAVGLAGRSFLQHRSSLVWLCRLFVLEVGVSDTPV
jgi:hypothetical protein